MKYEQEKGTKTSAGKEIKRGITLFWEIKGSLNWGKYLPSRSTKNKGVQRDLKM